MNKILITCTWIFLIFMLYEIIEWKGSKFFLRILKGLRMVWYFLLYDLFANFLHQILYMLVMNSLLIAFPVLHRSGLQFSRNESIYIGEWGTISIGYERRIGRHCCFQELQEVCIYSYPLSRKPSIDMRLLFRYITNIFCLSSNMFWYIQMG